MEWNYFASWTPLNLDLPRLPVVRRSKCRAGLTCSWHWSDRARVFRARVGDGVEFLEID